MIGIIIIKGQKTVTCCKKVHVRFSTWKLLLNTTYCPFSPRRFKNCPLSLYICLHFPLFITTVIIIIITIFALIFFLLCYLISPQTLLPLNILFLRSNIWVSSSHLFSHFSSSLIVSLIHSIKYLKTSLRNYTAKLWPPWLRSKVDT